MRARAYLAFAEAVFDQAEQLSVGLQAFTRYEYVVFLVRPESRYVVVPAPSVK